MTTHILWVFREMAFFMIFHFYVSKNLYKKSPILTVSTLKWVAVRLNPGVGNLGFQYDCANPFDVRDIAFSYDFSKANGT